MLFGELLISPEKLAEELEIRVPQIASEQSNPDTNEAYTLGVKHALKKIGEDLGLQTFLTNRKKGMKEFMLDVVWWRKTEDGEWAVLGAESEWGNSFKNEPQQRANEVIEDFDKLRSFKAPIKVLFFRADNSAMRAAIHSKITEYLQLFAQHVQGEQYLFLEFERQKQKCYSYLWVANQNGRCPDASLRALNETSANALQMAKASGI
jgi:hypothetical protein